MMVCNILNLWLTLVEIKISISTKTRQAKTEYAEENHINLLRVNYLMTEKSIEQHIVNKVNQCKAEALSDRV